MPPPVDELSACLDAFEMFLHTSAPALPPLIKAGLLHVQFESIHPFLDGKSKIKRRSQFRVNFRDLHALYVSFRHVDTQSS